VLYEQMLVNGHKETNTMR